jgi:hypothetical protein
MMTMPVRALMNIRMRQRSLDAPGLPASLAMCGSRSEPEASRLPDQIHESSLLEQAASSTEVAAAPSQARAAQGRYEVDEVSGPP